MSASKHAAVVVYGSASWDGPWLTEHNLARRLADTRPVVFVDPLVSVLTPVRYGVNRASWGRLRHVLRRARDEDGVRVVGPVILPPVTNRRSRSLSRGLARRQIREAVRTVAAARPALALVAGGPPDLVAVGGERKRVYLVKDLNEAGAGLLGLAADDIRAATLSHLRAADLVCATTEALRSTLAGWGFESRLLRHGFDAEMLAGAGSEPSAYRGLPRPLSGYVGRIDGRLDFDALVGVADRVEQGTLLLVGPVSPRLDRSGLDRLLARPNVRLVGPVSRGDVSAHVAHLDCAVMPYTESEWSTHASPLKLWDALGAGVAVAGCGNPVLREFPPPLVRYADAPAALHEAVARALEAPVHERAERRVFAMRNTWADRAAQLSAWLDELETEVTPGAPSCARWPR